MYHYEIFIRQLISPSHSRNAAYPSCSREVPLQIKQMHKFSAHHLVYLAEHILSPTAAAAASLQGIGKQFLAGVRIGVTVVFGREQLAYRCTSAFNRHAVRRAAPDGKSLILGGCGSSTDAGAIVGGIREELNIAVASVFRGAWQRRSVECV